MSKPAFPGIEPIRYQARRAANALAFRYYDKDQRSSASAWKTTCAWPSATGTRSSGTASTCSAPAPSSARGTASGDAGRAGRGEGRRRVRVLRASSASRSSASTTATSRPKARTLRREQRASSTSIVDVLEAQMQQHRREAAVGHGEPVLAPALHGAARPPTPIPDVFAFAAAQVKKALDATKRLGGENYVLWGGREGYETLLNTDMKHELDQMGRFLNMVVEHKHKIGFKGPLLIEPKPHEPTKHQYDFDSATVYAFFQKLRPARRTSRSTSKPTTPRWRATASSTRSPTRCARGIFGSIDMNRGDPQLGWDTDQFPNDLRETVAGDVPHRARPAASPPAASTSTPRCAARAIDAVGPVPRPRRRHGQPGARAAHRRQDAQRRQAAGRSSTSVTRAGTSSSARTSWRASCRWPICGPGAGGQAGSEAALGPPGDAREPGQPVPVLRVPLHPLRLRRPPGRTDGAAVRERLSARRFRDPGEARPSRSCRVPYPPDPNGRAAVPIEAADFIAWHKRAAAGARVAIATICRAVPGLAAAARTNARTGWGARPTSRRAASSIPCSRRWRRRSSRASCRPAGCARRCCPRRGSRRATPSGSSRASRISSRGASSARRTSTATFRCPAGASRTCSLGSGVELEAAPFADVFARELRELAAAAAHAQDLRPPAASAPFLTPSRARG